jgi:hypothetical protein
MKHFFYKIVITHAMIKHVKTIIVVEKYSMCDGWV